ncbi:MAG: nucleotidyltransferase domain-containing protein [Anaerolineae bacterium]|nr:nucleotidyltransferase domain-containing protein [Anaerolineae bacterium]
MHSVFTTFASSRFIDREAVVGILRTVAQRLKSQYAEIRAIHLFGSFAAGTATPRSDADVVIEVMCSADAARRERIAEAARSAFLEAPVPVELFILDSKRMQECWGIAGAVAREGVRLA